MQVLLCFIPDDGFVVFFIVTSLENSLCAFTLLSCNQNCNRNSFVHIVPVSAFTDTTFHWTVYLPIMQILTNVFFSFNLSEIQFGFMA